MPTVRFKVFHLLHFKNDITRNYTLRYTGHIDYTAHLTYNDGDKSGHLEPPETTELII